MERARGMQGRGVEDTNVLGYHPLVSPHDLKRQMPSTEKMHETVRNARDDIKRMLRGDDGRILLVVGPCSIHDVKGAQEYFGRLTELEGKVKDVFRVVARAYFEKPRTLSFNWRGLVSDPHLDGKGHMNDGYGMARGLLMLNAEMGLPSATEFLDTSTPQYYDDLIAWAAIGARTVESQLHVQMASGLSMPVGFKNGTSGNVQAAVNAVISARHASFFPGMDPDGQPAVVYTRGNEAHIVLRGSETNGTNYDKGSVESAQAMLSRAGLEGRLIMIDCSHGNSKKDFTRQPVVFEDVIKQVFDGNKGIMGLMLESNIKEGKQDYSQNPDNLEYGKSITDSCIGWETTERIITDAHRMLRKKM
jgi:3-deoxy-7-phosphoheptulonate synthase